MSPTNEIVTASSNQPVARVFQQLLNNPATVSATSLAQVLQTSPNLLNVTTFLNALMEAAQLRPNLLARLKSLAATDSRLQQLQPDLLAIASSPDESQAGLALLLFYD